MSPFTDGDPAQTHHLPRDEGFLAELPKSAQILCLLTIDGRFSIKPGAVRSLYQSIVRDNQ